MVSIEPPTLSQPVTMVHNADGQRVAKVSEQEERHFLYDHQKLLQEFDDADDALKVYTNSSAGSYGNLLSEYDPSSGGGGGGGGTLYPAFDAQQNAVAAAADDCDARRYRYTAFGNPAAGTDASWCDLTADQWGVMDADGWGNFAVCDPGTNQTFGGQQHYYRDPETELYLLGGGTSGGGRYYDPDSGRFLSRDPIGFAGGDVNLYRYVRNNPVNKSDPSGRETDWKRWDELTDAQRGLSLRLVRRLGRADVTAGELVEAGYLYGVHEGQWSINQDGFAANRSGASQAERSDQTQAIVDDLAARFDAALSRGSDSAIPVVDFMARRSGPWADYLRSELHVTPEEFANIHSALAKEFAGASEWVDSRLPGAIPGEMSAEEWFAQWQAQYYAAHVAMASLLGGTALFAGSFVPGVGEGMDAAVLADPNSSALDRTLAGGSLALSYWAAGMSPNFGAVRLPLRYADEVAGAGAAGGRAIVHAHHPLPKFLGGDVQQVLSRLDSKVHTEFHAVLRTNLRNAGIPLRVGGRHGSAADWARYMNANPGAQRKAFDAVLDASRDIDSRHGTSITQNVWANIISGSFRAYP